MSSLNHSPTAGWSALLMTFTLLSGCGGGDTAQTSKPMQGLGGNYVGFYLERGDGNPNDIDAGMLYLNVPKDDGTYTGYLSFQQDDCLDSNQLHLSGTKDWEKLTGTATGQLNNYSATLPTDKVVYPTLAGNFATNSVDYIGYYGKYTGSFGQTPPTFSCGATTQTLAPEIEWFAFMIGTPYPSTAYTLSNTGLTLNWTQPAASSAIHPSKTLISVIDVEKFGNAAESAFVLQHQQAAQSTTYTLPTNRVQAGKEYLVTVIVLDVDSKVIAKTDELLRF